MKTPTTKHKHSYYNTLVAAAYLRATRVEPCDELLDSGRCKFDECGNLVAIDGNRVVSRGGHSFKFAPRTKLDSAIDRRVMRGTLNEEEERAVRQWYAGEQLCRDWDNLSAWVQGQIKDIEKETVR